ncbi:unnamed protein product [Paramecium octaurelia]|uniref:WD domain, G-beta repeat protein n=1 Tax=Paramecium octaurelia TaxID=43137 RepID=A0A8S1YQS8_PAROT|nr:unnamed protein product [Paramecium octaurelia]
MNKNVGTRNDVYQQQIIECFEDVQNQIECSFNKMDFYLDSLVNNTSDSLNLNTFQKQHCIPILNTPLIKFENSNFAQSLCQDIQSLIKLNIKNQIKTKEQSLNQTNQLNLKQFTYQLIPQYSISQTQFCFTIAINEDCSILLVGCKSQIKVFEFKQGITKQTQIISDYQNDVYTLNFMKKSNQFISGSIDSSMIIWQLNQNNYWIPLHKLNGHTGSIYCLILNNNEDLIVSGSSDKKIKFWMKKNEWSCYQTIKDHSSDVYGLSLNLQQNRVVSCGWENLILIMEQQGQNKEWIVIQKIKLEQCALRVCFIDNSMFALSLYQKQQISIFEMNNIHVKCGSDCNSLFPQQYINSKCILVSKNGQYVNLIRKTLNGQFVTQQSIHFNTNSLFGVMSDNGEYLITWDNQSNQIQIRTYQQL